MMEKSSTITIKSMPPELLAKIFCLLNEKDIVSVSLSCVAFCSASKVEWIWQHKCRIVLGIKKIDLGKFSSYFELYTKLLYPYGYLVGMWRPHYGCYGGLMNIIFEDSKLICREYFAPPDPHITKPLTAKQVFEIKLKDEESDAEMICHGGYHGHHPCSIPKSALTSEEFNMTCHRPDSHIHPNGSDQEMEEWLWTQMDADETQHGFEAFYGIVHLLKPKFDVLSSCRTKFTCEKLHVNFSKPGALIQPGLFKGTYGSHGIELIQLDYDDDKNVAVFTKITGDPNIPCRQVSVKADLSRPMILTEQQQQSIRILQQIDIPDVSPDIPLSQLQPQPFVKPADCFNRNGLKEFPRTCKARFHSKGQIAGNGFFDPAFTDAHLIVFNEDTFANLWLTLSSISVYSRVKEFS